MNRLVKKFLSILVSVVMLSLSLNCNVFAEKIIFCHKPIFLSKNGEITICRYNDQINNAIFDYLYEEILLNREKFHPELKREGETRQERKEREEKEKEKCVGLLYAFNEQNGLPLCIHIPENDHYLIIRPKVWLRDGRSFSIQRDENHKLLFCYCNEEGNNVPEVLEIWEISSQEESE